MKKDIRKIYSAVFVAVSTIPLIALPFAKNNSEIEKKELSATPKLISDGKLNNNFSNDCETWYNDRLPFRAQLLSAANRIKGGVFETASSNVISGKDGWLFFEGSKDDYMNTHPLSASRIKTIAVSMSLVEERVVQNGGRFLFVAMPNKMSVYSEYVPDNYRYAGEDCQNNLHMLQSVLSEEGVSYLDMLKVMKDKKSFGLYHKRDTHWNNYGAYVGYNAIMNALARDHKNYSESKYEPKKTWRGDLDKLLYPFGGYMDIQYNMNLDTSSFEFVIPAGVTDTQKQLEIFMSDKEENDKRISTNNHYAPLGTNLYMIRDSFGRAILPYMIDNYENAMFVRADYPDMSLVKENTDMVYEIVERNIPELFKTAPLMTAPERDSVVSYSASDEKIDFISSNESYGIRLCGEIPEKNFGQDGRVYVKVSNGSMFKNYEAFPVLERQLLEKNDGFGFSLIIDPSELEPGEYSVEIITGGVSYLTNSNFRVELTSGNSSDQTGDDDQNISSDVVMIDGSLRDRLRIKYNDAEFSAGDNINSILSLLGPEAAPASSAASCLTGNTIYEYYYAGMTIQANESGEIFSVELSDNLYAGGDAHTAGGIRCGISQEDIVTGLGEPSSYEGKNMVYEEDGLSVQILQRGGLVSVILISDSNISN